MRQVWFGISVILATASAALADFPQVGDTVQLYQHTGGRGGQYEVANVSQAAAANFRTFCVERSASVDFDAGGFRVGNITDRTSGGQQISAQTAYLYTQFMEGNLAGFDGSARTAKELQKAIWSLEGQANSVGGLAGDWVAQANAAVAAGGSWYNQWGNGQGGYDGLNFLGNVRVMQLEYATARGGFGMGFDAQDQLVMVPAPGALLLGMIGLAAIRRAARSA